MQRLTTKEFISKANQIHNNAFGYELVCYETSRKRVTITCPIHGDFFQKPNDHLSGYGCGKCAGNTKRTTVDFLQIANEIHKGRYQYKDISISDSVTKISITCTMHGPFYQLPNNHLKGQGCPRCNQSKGELLVEDFLNELAIPFQPQYRFPQCRNKNPLPFDFALLMENDCCGLIEFQGEQHYCPKTFGSKEPARKLFENVCRNDRIKQKFCASVNMPLLTIPYSCKDIRKEIIIFAKSICLLEEKLRATK